MASIIKRTARGKTVDGVRVRRKGQFLEAAILENRATPSRVARKFTMTDLIERSLDTVMSHKRPPPWSMATSMPPYFCRNR